MKPLSYRIWILIIGVIIAIMISGLYMSTFSRENPKKYGISISPINRKALDMKRWVLGK